MTFCVFAKVCNETIAHCTNCSSMDVCRVFGPVQNLTCHECEENFLVGNDKASCKCKKLGILLQNITKCYCIVYDVCFVVRNCNATKYNIFNWLIFFIFILQWTVGMFQVSVWIVHWRMVFALDVFVGLI